MPFDAIGAADPADVAVGAGVEAGLGVVFALESVLDDFELEGADRAEEGDAGGAAGGGKLLDVALLKELGGKLNFRECRSRDEAVGFSVNQYWSS